MKEGIDERKDRWDRGCVCVAELTVSTGDRMPNNNLCRTELALIRCLSTSACFFDSLLTVAHQHRHISVSIETPENPQMVQETHSYSLFQFVFITPTLMQSMSMPMTVYVSNYYNMFCTSYLQHSCSLCQNVY